MEQNQDTSIFGLGIDSSSKVHLSEAARWARFLAIVGFVMCGLIVLLGVFAGSIFSSFSGRFGNDFGGASGMGMGSGLGGMLAVIYIIGALLYFFPCLFLFRFANLMKAAIATDEQENLNKSFQNLKIMFRYVGILTIIVLTLYLIGILIAIMGVAASGF